MKLVSSNKVETNRYELVIEIDGETFMKTVNAVYKKEVKNINIPGFRKGKAPRAMIEKMYGKGVFYEDAINELYPSALEFAIAEAGLEVVKDKPDVEIEKADSEALVIKTKLTVEPEVTIENYMGIAVKPVSTEVTDEDIEAEIKKVRQRNSRLVEVTDRPAQNEDTVVIDFKGIKDGEPFEGGTAVDVTFPENYQVEELKGQPVQFEIKLHKIQTRELPEFNEDFVKDVSEFDTIDAYKADIREKLAEDKKKNAESDKERQVADKLAELMQAEVPEVMYENQVDNLVDEFEMNLRMQGIDLKTYMEYTGLTDDVLHQTYYDRAVSQVKVRLALKKIAKLENIEVTDEEVENKYKELADNYKVEVDKVKGVFPAKDIKSDLETAKALALVENAAVYTEA